MASKSFRDYLETLEDNNQVLHVTDEIDPLDEMGAFIARADYNGMDKAIMFDNPKGYDIPVIANTVGNSYSRIAAVFDVPEDRAVPAAAEKMMDIIKAGGIPPVYVDQDTAPCREVIQTGDDVDLSKLPILRLNPEDGTNSRRFLNGRFICSLAVSKPDENSHNLSYHRFEETGPNEGPIWIYRGTGDAKSIEEAWGAKIDDPSSSWDHDKAKPFPMAFVFGVGPEFILAGANSALPYKNDDFAYIGALNGEAVEMVKCETIDVDVPANAEIIVEGVLKPFDWAMQGRFASFNGMYDESRRRPVFHVTAITMRKKPIFQHVHIGLPLNETNSIASFFRSIKIYASVKEIMPNLIDVFVEPAAGCGFTAHISIDKKRIGEPKMAMMRAYTAMAGFTKHVFVYDADIDIRDPHERNWALAHRFMPDRDLMIIPNIIGMGIEPLAQAKMGTPAKLGVYDGHNEILMDTRSLMGVDCTSPLGIKTMDRVVKKPELEKRVDELWKNIDL